MVVDTGRVGDIMLEVVRVDPLGKVGDLTIVVVGADPLGLIGDILVLGEIVDGGLRVGTIVDELLVSVDLGT